MIESREDARAARAPESEGNCQARQNVSMKIQVFEFPARIGSRSMIDHKAHNLLLFTLSLCICVCHLGSCRHTMAAHACMHACYVVCSYTAAIRMRSLISHEFGSTRGSAIFLLVAGRKLQAICYWQLQVMRPWPGPVLKGLMESAFGCWLLAVQERDHPNTPSLASATGSFLHTGTSVVSPLGINLWQCSVARRSCQ